MLKRDIFKANDLRGVIAAPGAQWDLDGVRAVGAAFVRALELTGREFVLGRDMRVSGAEVAGAFIAGALAQGADVVDIGLASTDQLWFASGTLGLPGVQVTASHNPAEYNGLKFCLAQAAPITGELMAAIREAALGPEMPPAAHPGRRRSLDLLTDYAAQLHGLVDMADLPPLRVVVDAGNGMAGLTTPAVLTPLGLDVIGVHLELDGTFPNHPPNPLVEENLLDARRAVREHAADLALVFDGDADRCFIIDERGEVVSPSTVTALIAAQELDREPGATIVVNTITSRTVAEVVAELGGTLVTSRVGHTSVKALMAEHGAIFGGEHSAHYYFRDFWGADTGMVAALHVLAMLGRSEATMSELAARYDRYLASGEINSVIDDAGAALERVAAAFEDRGAVSWHDGLLVEGDAWWVSVRSSNTEPLVRLNIEARDPALLATLRDEALALIRRKESR